jgi:NitT/TauT family transport system substrate-binding protein
MRRWIILALVVALAAVGLGACGQTDEQAAQKGSGGQGQASAPIRLAVGIDSIYSPMFLAAEQGIFKREGLNVEVRQFAQGGEGVDALIAGSMDAAGTGDSTFLLKSAQGQLRALGVWVRDTGNYIKLVVRPQITSVRQIKTFGVVPGSVAEYGTAKLLEHEHIDPSSVKLVQAGPPELPALLDKGDIDAFVVWEPWPTKAQQLGMKVLEPARAWGFSYFLLIAVKPEWLDAHRNEAKALMRALAEADRQVEANPGAAAQATLNATKIDPKLTEQAVKQLDFAVEPFSQADRAHLADLAAFLRDRGILKQQVEPNQLLAEGIVPGG